MQSEQHIHAMNLEKKHLLDESPASYAPITWALTDVSLEEMRFKFDIAYFIAKENIAFTKYSLFCELKA